MTRGQLLQAVIIPVPRLQGKAKQNKTYSVGARQEFSSFVLSNRNVICFFVIQIIMRGSSAKNPL